MGKKNFEAYTKQCTWYQNNNVTLAIYANLVPAQSQRFAEIIDKEESKLKVTLNDFEKGKGDNATKVYYNLSIKEFRYIKTNYKRGSLPEYKGIKSLDTYKESSGPYQGLAQIRRILVQYMGTSYKYPWKIEITNGYGADGKISAGEKKASAFLNDIDFEALWDDTEDYINAFMRLFSRSLIKQGLTKIEEYKRDGYSEDFSKNSQPQNQPPTQEQPQSQPQGQAQNQPPELHPTRVQFVSEFVAVQNCYAVQILTKGQTYTVYCHDVTEEMRKAQREQVIVTVNLYKYKDSLILHSMVGEVYRSDIYHPE